MNMNDKTRSITVRLTPEQYAYLEHTAHALEVTPSKFLRMVVNASMVGSAIGHKALDGLEAQSEHREADSDNLV